MQLTEKGDIHVIAKAWSSDQLNAAAVIFDAPAMTNDKTEYKLKMTDLCTELAESVRDDGYLVIRFPKTRVSTIDAYKTAVDIANCGKYNVIKNKIDRAWLAALVDGEGCITYRKDKLKAGETYSPRLQIKMTDPQALEHCAAITESSKLSDAVYSPSRQNNKSVYTWVASGDKAARIISDIYPYLLIKKQQAAAALTLNEVSELDLKAELKLLLNNLNARNCTDLPDYLVTPERKTPTWWLAASCFDGQGNPVFVFCKQKTELIIKLNANFWESAIKFFAKKGELVINPCLESHEFTDACIKNGRDYLCCVAPNIIDSNLAWDLGAIGGVYANPRKIIIKGN